MFACKPPCAPLCWATSIPHLLAVLDIDGALHGMTYALAAQVVERSIHVDDCLPVVRTPDRLHACGNQVLVWNIMIIHETVNPPALVFGDTVMIHAEEITLGT